MIVIVIVIVNRRSACSLTQSEVGSSTFWGGILCFFSHLAYTSVFSHPTILLKFGLKLNTHIGKCCFTYQQLIHRCRYVAVVILFRTWKSYNNTKNLTAVRHVVQAQQVNNTTNSNTKIKSNVELLYPMSFLKSKVGLWDYAAVCVDLSASAHQLSHRFSWHHVQKCHWWATQNCIFSVTFHNYDKVEETPCEEWPTLLRPEMTHGNRSYKNVTLVIVIFM